MGILGTGRAARTTLGRRNRLARLVAVAAALPMAVGGLVAVAAPASAAAVSADLLPSGFPVWYEDNAGSRVEPCVDANDANCVLPPASDTYDPNQPLVFPTNFPDEFFYALATSENLTTPGCGPASPPGRASVRLALEGAFINGAPAGGDQMVFGRIRVRVTSGLCPDTPYLFRHPFGETTLRTNGAGQITATVGTTDVGCVPTATVRCDFTKANLSPVMGDANGGFLRWDTGAPAGYLGDGVTLHAVTGGTNGNAFEIVDGDGASVGRTALFSVAGKLAGPLMASPSPLDFAAQTVNTASAPQIVKVKNISKVAVTTGGNAVRLRDRNPAYRIDAGTTTCVGVTVNPGGTCDVGVVFAPSTTGTPTDVVEVAFTGGVPAGIRSPLTIPVTGHATTAGQQPVVGLSSPSLAFGDVRLRSSVTKRLTVTNSGNAALKITSVGFTDDSPLVDLGQYRIAAESCSTGGRSLNPGATCTVDVVFAPTVADPHNVTLRLLSNAVLSPTDVPVTGTGTGGVAAVSTAIDATNGFPEWYRDENGVKVAQCLDPKDPYCIVLPDATFDPANPVRFPTNFPGEFFWTVADSDLITTPGCNGTAPGRAAMRVAIEGTFVNGEPVADEQMVFGRVRVYATGGLCPDSDYVFTTPYGPMNVRTNAKGAIGRARGTEDIGCAPLPPERCDFSEALSAPVFGGILRWDPAVAPAAPPGYLGDAVSLHRVVGAPYRDNAGTPQNLFRISGPGLATPLSTNLFSVMGKLRGPLEVTSPLSASGSLTLSASPVGSPSTATVTLTNTGVAVGASTGAIAVGAVTTTGVDAAEFGVAGNTCSGTTLPVGGSCTLDVTFTPAATGLRGATLRVAHDGLNNPLTLGLNGTGQDRTGAAISFTPRTLDLGPLGTGRTSAAATVTVSNAGGASPLDVSAVALQGPGAAQYTITADGCTGTPVDPDGECTVSVVFAPAVAGPAPADLVFTDNAGGDGSTHRVALSANGFGGAPAVSSDFDEFGFPRWYQDANGTRLQPCLDASGNCVVLGADPGAPLSFANNFPDEFFYALADSDLVQLDTCGTGAGTAMLRVGLEGTFFDGVPLDGDQMTFTRIRLSVTGGLCADTTYDAVTPYGVFQFTTDGTGALKRATGTQDEGCGAAPCVFADATVPVGTVYPSVATPIQGFLRWDPNVGAAAPAGYLGDSASLHRVVGGTYVPAGGSAAFNGFRIRETGNGDAGAVLGSTDLFLVSGKVAGPIYADTTALDFGRTDQGVPTAARTVRVTNAGAAGTTVTASLAGADAGSFQVLGTGTCGAVVAQDGSCTVDVRFAPGTAGDKAARLVLTPSSGPAVTVALTGTADPVGAPVITVSPGVVSFGTVTAGTVPAVTRTLTVSNATGTAPLVVSDAVLGGAAADDYARTGGTCAAAFPWTVPATQSCTVVFTFTPKAVGSRTATYTLAHNATGGSTLVQLTGTGAGAAWQVSPSPVGFGTVAVNTTKTLSLTVKNSGTVAGTITTATTSAPFGVTLTPATSTCFNGTAVQPGKGCTIVVTFRPGAAQTFGADLVIQNGPQTPASTTTVRLTGTGR